MAKYEDTFTPSERFGDLEFTWDVDFPRLLSNSPEAEQPSEFLKLRSPLTGTGARTNIPEGLSEEDVYQAWKTSSSLSPSGMLVRKMFTKHGIWEWGSIKL